MSSVVLMHHHRKSLKWINLTIIIIMFGLLKLLTRPINHGEFERWLSITDRFVWDKDWNSFLSCVTLILLICIFKMSHKVNRGFLFSGETKLSHVRKHVAADRCLDWYLPKPGSSSHHQVCVDQSCVIKCCMLYITLDHIEQGICLCLIQSSYNFIEKKNSIPRINSSVQLQAFLTPKQQNLKIN